jgi:hypothetical protein
MKKVLVIWVMFTCLISCDNLGKTHFTDLDFRRDGRNEFAYKKDGTVFTGTAWSSDGKTVKIDVSNGVITTVTVYHSNGKIAGTTHPGTRGSDTFYNTNGNTLTEQQFMNQYPDVMAQLNALEYEVHYIEK